jgi:hypothetical protein
MIGTRKHRIDLYVWLDGRGRRAPGYMFSRADFLDEICGWLGLDRANIRE